jgi:hypothetical protein
MVVTQELEMTMLKTWVCVLQWERIPAQGATGYRAYSASGTLLVGVDDVDSLLK